MCSEIKTINQFHAISKGVIKIEIVDIIVQKE